MPTLDPMMAENRQQVALLHVTLVSVAGVMIAWTGIEHFHMGRYDPPPPACEPDDAVVRLFLFWLWLELECMVFQFV